MNNLVKRGKKVSNTKGQYKCYSPQLKENLENKGFKPVRNYKNSITQKTAWVYKVTPELSNALTEWTRNRPTL